MKNFILKVSGKTDIKKLSGSILKIFTDQKDYYGKQGIERPLKFKARVIGAAALNQLTKAVAIANELTENNEKIYMSPMFSNVELENQKTTCLLIEISYGKEDM